MTELLTNRTFVSAALAWCAAQILKAVIDFWVQGTFSLHRLLLGSGGMPSSHSAAVCALATSAGLQYGLDSFNFTISFVFAFIVMYDAAGVRLETGKQAKAINAMIEEFQRFLGEGFRYNGDALGQNLKELVGHTPLQVFCGALLGVASAIIAGVVFYGH